MHKVIKALREQAQPILAKIKAGDSVSPQELKHATEMYELAYYLRKFGDMEPDEDSEDGNNLIHHLRNELNGAEEYYNFWIQTRIPEYKMMAQQELSHAEFWAKQIRQAGIPQDQFESEVTMHGKLTEKLR